MEDFVTYDLAVKLKDKGFPQVKKGTLAMYDELYPTISQVLKWLRKEKEIHIAVGYSGETKWRYVIIYVNEAYFDNPNITVKRFDSYEQAALDGIKYVLDNLI